MIVLCSLTITLFILQITIYHHAYREDIPLSHQGQERTSRCNQRELSTTRQSPKCSVDLSRDSPSIPEDHEQDRNRAPLSLHAAKRAKSKISNMSLSVSVTFPQRSFLRDAKLGPKSIAAQSSRHLHFLRPPTTHSLRKQTDTIPRAFSPVGRRRHLSGADHIRSDAIFLLALAAW